VSVFTRGINLKPDLQEVIQFIFGILGVGVIASILAVLWYRQNNPDALDKDTVIGLFKIFMGISVGIIICGLLYLYVLR
jgi:hypothetical protein